MHDALHHVLTTVAASGRASVLRYLPGLACTSVEKPAAAQRVHRCDLLKGRLIDLRRQRELHSLGTFFCPHCGALYSVTYSRLSKSDSNIDVPLARSVRAASITSAR